jgi:hypothetical protein
VHNRAVARADDGSFVVVWDHTQPGLLRNDVFARRYSATGVALGTAFQVNGYATGTQQRPAVGVSPDGSFVVVWEDNSFRDGTALSVFARRVSSDDILLGDDFAVPSYTAGNQEAPDVAAAPDGGFVAVWGTRLIGESYGGIGARRFGSDGTPLGTEFKVETYTTETQSTPSVAMDGNGNFVVVWASGGYDPGPDGANSGIAGRMFQADATPLGDEFVVNVITGNHQIWPAVDVNSAGSFVVAWQNDDREGGAGPASVSFRRFGANGTPLGGQFDVDPGAGVDQYRPDVSVDSASRFVVSWTTYDDTAYEQGVAGRCFDAGGNPQGAAFELPAPQLYRASYTSVAADTGGDFVVVWSGAAGNGASQVYARVFDRPVVATTTTTTTTTTLPSGATCGDPIVDASAVMDSRPAAIRASDALFILQSAVGLQVCQPCICDVTGEGNIAASDALIVLNAAVGISVTLNCPVCT